MYLHEGYKILKRLVPAHSFLCLYTYLSICLQNISKKNMKVRSVEIQKYKNVIKS